METFKDRMRRIRLRAGFTSQGKAAAAIGCERGTVSMWEAPSSNVQAVSGDLLFAVARVYQVRPQWINNLRDKSDGYPWLNDSAHTETPAKSVFDSPQQSHLLTLDQDILHEAITLLVHDEQQGGQYTPRAHTARLAELYARVAADGGRLTAQHNRDFTDEVHRRAKERVSAKPPTASTRRRNNHD